MNSKQQVIEKLLEMNDRLKAIGNSDLSDDAAKEYSALRILFNEVHILIEKEYWPYPEGASHTGI